IVSPPATGSGDADSPGCTPPSPGRGGRTGRGGRVMAIKVLVVDDHDLGRIGISRMLGDVEGIKELGQAPRGEEAVKMARELAPDVVLMDVQMPGIGGLEATRKIQRVDDGIKVIAVTVCDEEPFPSRLLKAGASGYLTKGADLQEMVRAIRVVNV